MEVVTHTLSQARIVAEAERIQRSSRTGGTEHECLLDVAIVTLVLGMLDTAEAHGIEVTNIECQRGFELPGWKLSDDDTAEVTFLFEDPSHAVMFRFWMT